MTGPRVPFAAIIGAIVYGTDDGPIGQVRRVLLDEVTGRPEWIAVATGVLGARQRLVPISVADLSQHRLRVPFTGEAVESAPRFDPRDSQPSEQIEEELYRHYRMTDTDSETETEAGARRATPLFVELVRGYEFRPRIHHPVAR